MAKKPRCPRCGSDSRVPDLVWTSCSHPWHQIAASPAPAQEPCVWQPIETAPRDGTRFDVWAKAWLPAFDRFEYRRFADCYWRDSEPMGAWRAGVVGVDKGWRATHWMPLPAPPSTPSREDHSGDGSSR